MSCSACKRGHVTRARDTAPEGDTEYCDTRLPTSKVFEPASVTESEIFASGCKVFNRSAQRPPQPVSGGLSGMEVCHCVTWSAWEKSWGGNAMEPAPYWARVIG